MWDEHSTWIEDQQAVNVKNALKTYGSKKRGNTVLQDLNMSVVKGSIYGLLGASGCGKTTLLSCIVGRRKLNSGEIWVLGGKPGDKNSGVPGKRVGYMPQETALHGEFTIRETMLYFGWIFGMQTPEIVKRLQFLLEFLDLPNQARIVKTLSGGQQRRVSFAAALIHDPELLILDEPTVGVDPLLRQSIWNYLVQISNDSNKTIIVTTHYIEEARQAHTIGLMRSGKLLAEESPDALLLLYQAQTLEEVFLKLSQKQEQGTSSNSKPLEANNEKFTKTLAANGDIELEVNHTKNQSDRSDRNSYMTPKSSSENGLTGFTTWGKNKALLLKNVLRMWRNPGIMLFVFFLPVLQVILFCVAIGQDPNNLNLAVFNNEQHPTNKTCDIVPGCKFEFLSCRYLNTINKRTINQVSYSDKESAIEAVKEGNAWGAVYISNNFSETLLQRLFQGQSLSDSVLEQSEIKVWLDLSNQQIQLIMVRDLQLAYQEFIKDLLASCGENPNIANIPVTFQDPIYGTSKTNFTDFVAPGVVMSLIFFLAVALTASSLILERIEGLLDRSWVAGVSPGEVLFGHIATQFFVMCGQTALILVFMMLVFNVECVGNLGLLIFLSLLQGLVGMTFGFVISALCEQERSALQVAMGSFYPTLLLSGVIWPIEGMPIFLRKISQFLPATWPTAALRAIMTRGWDITKSEVYYGFISSFAWIAVFLCVTLIALKIKRG